MRREQRFILAFELILYNFYLSVVLTLSVGVIMIRNFFHPIKKSNDSNISSLIEVGCIFYFRHVHMLLNARIDLLFDKKTNGGLAETCRFQAKNNPN